MKFYEITLISLVAVLGCHDHGHGGHEHGGHGGHGGHEHGGHGGHGHGGGHGADVGAVVITHFTKQTELFVEIPPLETGKSVHPAIHLTTLSDFRPVTEGSVVFVLGKQEFSVGGPASPGIFRPAVKPKTSGTLALSIRLSAGKLNVVHELGSISVYGPHDLRKHMPDHDSGGISFLKEQQWRMDFALAEAKLNKLRPSFEAYGTLRPRSDGEARVAAPIAGRLAVMNKFPKIGRKVRRGDLLSLLIPRLGDQGDRASLQQAVQRAQIALRQAKRKHERLKGLLKGGAVAERQVIDARFAQEQAQSELNTARQRSRQARRVQRTGRQTREGALEVRAPLSGTIVEVSVAPGAFVKAGAPMFRIVDLSELWLEVHVAEAHAAELEEVRGVWFTVEGFGAPFEAGKDRIVAVGGVVDTHSRTLPLYLSVENTQGRLKVGMFADVHVVTGEVIDAVTIPVTSIVRESGLPVAYVQLSGEAFERRYVRLGIRDGAQIQVLEGIKAGERVVSVGAYAVRLAGASGQAPGHGHAH